MINRCLTVCLVSLPLVSNSQAESQSQLVSFLKDSKEIIDQTIDLTKAVFNATASGADAVSNGISTIKKGIEVFGKFVETGQDIQNNPDNTEYRATLELYANMYVDGELGSQEAAATEAFRMAKATSYAPFNKKLFLKQFDAEVKKIQTGSDTGSSGPETSNLSTGCSTSLGLSASAPSSLCSTTTFETLKANRRTTRPKDSNSVY